MSDSAIDQAVARARSARAHARAAYSGFKVGAALVADDGRTFTGCNIENATYGLTMCAERVALFKALSEGANIFSAVVIVAAAATPTTPCGACRQLLWEFCGDIAIVLANEVAITARYRLSELLPAPFDRAQLGIPDRGVED